ncbi:recombinase RecT [Spiroplasma endosymbiont of Poecilobothrus nobilitatus]|uniref:recombinase RecT n=1 Tax=Spiroplasma endosymbiont of Poecilobothrus nobilitatus TaxID=1209220 RepID=UPI00313D4AD8
MEIKNYLEQPNTKNWLNTKFKNEKEKDIFVKNVLSIWNKNKLFTKCELNSILSACYQGMLLNLPIDQNLGFIYVLPYYNEKENKYLAQLQIGYKGYIQLAIRTGQYLTINAIEVKDGELKNYNFLKEEYNFNWIEDKNQRIKKETIGYVAYFKLLNGFEKTLFWTKEQCESHFSKYSQTYKKYGKFMVSGFGDMALKTVLSTLLKKWGIMNIEMQEAYKYDQTVINDENNINYIDNQQLINIESNNNINNENEKNNNFDENVLINDDLTLE